MTRIAGDWLQRLGTSAVFDALTGAGHGAWFVGGCVRDALVGRPVGDIDIATDATPDTVIALTEAAGLKSVPTGIDHGTVTVVSDELAHEVTTLRRDVETDGRRAVVAFSEDIAEDAARRDFTMNALYATPDGEVLDPLGSGVDDLVNGRVRFVGDPSARIREDYLRILRFFRFLARFGAEGPEAEALTAIAENLDGLDTLSAERVGHEVLRLLGSEDPCGAVASMAAVGVLARVLPGADANWLPVLVHLEAMTGTEPDPIRRLSALGIHDAADRLRLSKAEARQLDRLTELIGDPSGPAEIAYRYGATTAQDVALLRGALGGGNLEPDAFAAARAGEAAEFPVKAGDLMPKYAGAALGARLAELEDRWVASGFSLTREDLLES